MVSIGDTVQDGYKPTESWAKAGTEWLDELAEFFKERSVIEREAAQKLTQLTQKHFTKKSAVSANVSVGTHPTTTPGSLENGSLQAWTEILKQTEIAAEERKALASDFQSRSDELQKVFKRFEDLNSFYSKFYSHIEENRDQIFTETKRMKEAYDNACQTMESARSKNRKVDQRTDEMYNAKAAYILSITVANRLRDKFYYDDVPELLDSWQRASEGRVTHVNSILTRACDVELSRLKAISETLNTSRQAVLANSPELDSRMFAEHNVRVLPTQPDFVFVESPIWHDDEQIFTGSESALRYLRAKLGHAEDQAAEAGSDAQERMATYEKSRAAVIDAKSSVVEPGQLVAMLRGQASALEKLVEAETRRLGAEAEIGTLNDATEGIDMSSIPVTRTVTHRTLLGKKKEVVKVVDSSRPQRTGGLGLKSLLARASGAQSSSSIGPYGTAHVLYAFEAGGPGEVSVESGSALPLVARDDGSGWVRVNNGGTEGLVPASYVEIVGPPSSKSGPPPPPAPRGSAKTVIAQYNYDAADASQLSIKAGDSITVLEGDSGGWTRGRLNGEEGIFPTSYAQ